MVKLSMFDLNVTSVRFQYPNKISLICLGPLTNIALAVKTYSEIKDKVNEIFMMGGNFRGSDF